MRSQLNQRGFAVVEGVLGVLLVIAIAAAGYFAYQARHNATTHADASAAPATAAKTSAPVDPYKGWQTFTSKINGLTFKYPADWQGQIDLTDQSEGGKLTSPDGFELNVANNPTGLGGGCDQNGTDEYGCPYIETFSAQPVSLAGVAASTYLVKYYLLGASDRSDLGHKVIGLYTKTNNGYGTDDFITTSETKNFPPYLIVTDTAKSQNGSAWIYGMYPETSPQAKTSAAKYYSLPDLKSAELILKSVKFQ